MLEKPNIRGLLREAAELSIRLCGAQPPVNERLFARKLGIAEITPASIASDGYIGRRSDGRFVIRYSDESPRHRQRFTIAHEIAHLLLAHATGEDILTVKDRRNGPDSAEELLANRVAAEILMPSPLFECSLRELASRGIRSPWKAINELRRRFDVAASAVALRILELEHLVAVFFRFTISGTGPRFPFDGSKGIDFTISENLDDATARIWREYRQGNRFFNVQVSGVFGQLTIRCEGSPREISTNDGKLKQLWVVGWAFVGE
jgi:hypothetical protein